MVWEDLSLNKYCTWCSLFGKPSSLKRWWFFLLVALHIKLPAMEESPQKGWHISSVRVLCGTQVESVSNVAFKWNLSIICLSNPSSLEFLIWNSIEGVENSNFQWVRREINGAHQECKKLHKKGLVHLFNFWKGAACLSILGTLVF